MKTLLTKILPAFLALSAAAQAAPGDLCRAIGKQAPLAEIQAAVAAGEGPNTLCQIDGCSGDTALVCAIHYSNQPNRDELPLYLIRQGADPTALNVERYAYHKLRSLTSFQWTARGASTAVLRAFLERNPDVDFAPNGRTALSWAIEGQGVLGSQWENVETLLSAGADPYSVEFSLKAGAKAVTETALSKILLNRSAPQRMVEKLLSGWDFSRDPLDKSTTYLTRLLASRYRTQAIVAYLIKMGADPSSLPAADGTRVNALTLLAEYARFAERPTSESEDARIADYLLSLGLDAGEQKGRALTSAVASRSAWLASRLLAKGVSANTKDGPVPVLSVAAGLNDLVMIRLLLASGADINLENQETGHTPLVQAIRFGNALEAVNELIRNGADLNHPDKDGRTPLCLAKNWGRQDEATILLSKGASLGVCSRER